MPDEYSTAAVSSSSHDDLATEYAAWIAGVAADHPTAAWDRAKRAFADIFACMIAGADDLATAAVRQACSTWGNGPCTVIGAERRQAAPWAAFVNATAAHALDFDDNFDPAKAHATAVLAPALLALAEERSLTGRAVLDAYIVGLEIAADLGRTLNPAHRDSGWHATATIGVIAAAAACARLMALDVPHTTHALNAAASFAGGTMSQFGTAVKAAQAGKAAQGGIVATQLAAAGTVAGSHSLDGPYGLKRMMGASPQLRSARAHRLGTPLAILEYGLKIKVYPCCASTHRAIDGALALCTNHRFEPRDIVRIDVHLPEAHLANLMHEVPRDACEARFSLPYCLAVAFTHGRVALEDFCLQSFPDATLRPLMRRIHGYGVAASEQDFATRVDVLLTNGKRISQTVDAPKGRSDNPLSDAELRAKFHACCDRVIGAERADMLADALSVMDTVSVNRLMPFVRGPSTPAERDEGIRDRSPVL
jgi:2-methylcitrate dehydratase PrpD